MFELGDDALGALTTIIEAQQIALAAGAMAGVAVMQASQPKAPKGDTPKMA